MSKVIDIALKDLTRSLRSASALAFMFGIPLLVTGLFYLMFSSGASQGEFNLPRTRLVIANLDQNAPRLQASSRSVPGGIRADTLSELVVNVLRSEKMADLLEVSLVPDAATARGAVDNRQAQVAIIIPNGFSRQFSDPNGQAEIEFYQDPTLTLGPGVVRSILSQFMDGLAGVKIVVNIAMDQLDPAEFDRIGQIIQQYMDASPVHDEDLATSLLDERLANKPGDGSQQNAKSLIRMLGPISLWDCRLDSAAVDYQTANRMIPIRMNDSPDALQGILALTAERPSSAGRRRAEQRRQISRAWRNHVRGLDQNLSVQIEFSEQLIFNLPGRRAAAITHGPRILTAVHTVRGSI